LQDEDLFVHKLLSPLFTVFICKSLFLNGSWDMSQVAFMVKIDFCLALFLLPQISM